MSRAGEIFYSSISQHVRANSVIITSLCQRRLVGDALSGVLHGEVVSVGEPAPCATHYLGVGAGAVMDASKAVAVARGAALTLVSCVLSTDAAFSDVAARCEEGCGDTS
jgi:stage V sporulation protein SpoVS